MRKLSLRKNGIWVHKMINLDGLKNACNDLFKRTGIFIEIRDANSSVIYTSNEKKNIISAKNRNSIIPRSNKNVTIYAMARNGTAPDDLSMQLISAYIEPFLASEDANGIFTDFIYGKISDDIFAQRLITYNIPKTVTYRLYIIRCTPEKTEAVFYIAKEISDMSKGDILFKLNDENIILIKECASELSADEAGELASALVQTISMETGSGAISIAASRVYDSLSQVKKAYACASDTMRLGLICSTGKNVFVAEKLRIEVFLDMLPESVLREFLALNLGQTISDVLDDKMIEIAQAVFDNNLNLSVTARELYIHRNTLVYRLEKIKKVSGFDVRTFEDAVMFKILMTADMLLNKK